ncbi:MAG TPA: tripartite tricarboxylate transporter substrate binding protein, partial [Thermodesulfobacteriota bacterium]
WKAVCRVTMLGLAAAAVAAAPLAADAAESFPSKPIVIYVGSAAGSPVDLYARKIAKLAEPYLKVPVQVQNREGGSSTIAMSAMLAQPADGYTLYGATRSITTVLVERDTGFTVEDFAYIVRSQVDPFVFAVPGSSPFKTLEEFVAAAKRQPGKFKVAGFGSGTPHHIAMQRFAQVAGFTYGWIPYDGGSAATAAAMGGHVDAVMTNPGQLRGKGNRIRGLAVTNPERIPSFPDIPTMRELGYPVTDLHWRGLVTKKGVPADRLEILHQAFKKAMETKEWEDFTEQQGQLSGYLDPKAFMQAAIEDTIDARAMLQRFGLIK